MCEPFDLHSAHKHSGNDKIPTILEHNRLGLLCPLNYVLLAVETITMEPQ